MKKPYVISIGGGSGSGKTTFLKNVRKAFHESETCCISMDDYYKPKEVQKKDPFGVINYDLPFSIDKKRFRKDLKKLIAGEDVEIKEYTFNNEKKKAKKIILKPAPIILVEGLFVFHYKKLQKLIDLRIFIEAKDNLKVIRRIKRDKEERNYPLQEVLHDYQHHVLPAYEKYILPYLDEVDLIVNNNDHFNNATEVVIGFIKNKLSNLV